MTAPPGLVVEVRQEGFRNRLLVFLDWAYTYLFREPGVRILPDEAPEP